MEAASRRSQAEAATTSPTGGRIHQPVSSVSTSFRTAGGPATSRPPACRVKLLVNVQRSESHLYERGARRDSLGNHMTTNLAARRTLPTTPLKSTCVGGPSSVCAGGWRASRVTAARWSGSCMPRCASRFARSGDPPVGGGRRGRRRCCRVRGVELRRAADHGRISLLAVAEPHRRGHIGTRLCGHAMKAAGVQVVELGTGGEERSTPRLGPCTRTSGS